MSAPTLRHTASVTANSLFSSPLRHTAFPRQRPFSSPYLLPRRSNAATHTFSTTPKLLSYPSSSSPPGTVPAALSAPTESQGARTPRAKSRPASPSVPTALAHHHIPFISPDAATAPPPARVIHAYAPCAEDFPNAGPMDTIPLRGPPGHTTSVGESSVRQHGESQRRPMFEKRTRVRHPSGREDREHRSQSSRGLHTQRRVAPSDYTLSIEHIESARATAKSSTVLAEYPIVDDSAHGIESCGPSPICIAHTEIACASAKRPTVHTECTTFEAQTMSALNNNRAHSSHT
ncbi:hypothetical protein P154DRAFT_618355 [Amniculicola lignicola CBS 123094]|uniref:Uncharacterized protein n=1 Tax=Amniculicola lignicola CBS 123094 TaxID=1392246 RepID=A0A6A5WPC9_9PLEO|nr:hypothetical protein P154DRAFT_618355 [Amniculicola lignicola CBS 123094]